jgi:hypothetical protein
MNPRFKKILTIIFTVLAVGLVLLSGTMKLIQFPQVVELLEKMGVIKHIYLFAAMEISFALLFLYSKTSRIGFILLSCYFAGALATEISHSSPPVAVGLLVLIWVTAFLRDRTIFFVGSSKKELQGFRG